ncbi:MAG: DUF305 domain-containing protein [Candidatus Parcubacteria bacterium]|nr:DUF305 domain-containing protein [Candidatus Paceibacterota bacterium]
MTNQNPIAQNKSTKTVILSYLSTLALFIGTAFVSGAIVHTGNISELYKYLVIGIIGIGLFIAGSFVQESIINSKNLQEEGVAKFFLFSLMLSVGIGMISGGTQHFSDFPVYSSYLIPIGLIVSYLAFLLKNNFTFTKNLVVIGLIFTVIGGVGFIGLNTYAKTLVAQSAKDNLCKTASSLFEIQVEAGGEHQDANCQSTKTEEQLTKSTHTMDAMIVDDKSFIEYVIPHHQEAVDSSKLLLKTTADLELKPFLENVIKTQSQEIDTLKKYHKQWFGTDYQNNNKYKSMMRVTKTGIEADKEYLTGMVGHHGGIIDTLNSVLLDSKYQFKPQLLELSKQIIADQKKDNILLTGWLNTKYSKISETQTSSKSVTQTDPHGH